MSLHDPIPYKKVLTLTKPPFRYYVVWKFSGRTTSLVWGPPMKMAWMSSLLLVCFRTSKISRKNCAPKKKHADSSTPRSYWHHRHLRCPHRCRWYYYLGRCATYLDLLRWYLPNPSQLNTPGFPQPMCILVRKSLVKLATIS